MSEQDVEDRVVGKFMRHIMPLLGIMYLIAYIDRQNIGFAKLQMAPDLGISEYAFGLGASLFFLAYFIFEVPSNIIMERVGARRWFTRIMVSWGLVTLALAFTQNEVMFYILRFLLGVAEAGFFPGVLYLMTLWVPFGHRARMIGWFMMASMIANVVGAPICGVLLDLNGLWGLAGWQWVFIITGVPAILMGFVVIIMLPSKPEDAGFYSDAEKDWLRAKLDAEDTGKSQTAKGNPFKALTDGRVLLIALTYVGFPLAAYGLSYWLPTVVKGFGVSNTMNGLINMLPWIAAAWALWYVPRRSERTGERTLHIVIPALIGAVCLVLSVVVDGNIFKYVLLCIAAAMILSPQPVFWTLPSSFLTGRGAAAGLAAINSVGNLGGFISQNIVPYIKVATGSDLAPMFFLGACLAFAGCMVIVIQMVLRKHQPT
ncbi:Sugar phosphate permease [Arboricoccus pini]|uniref:Sugar phosphate permease n=1 Tax=Arboricoccus pini TaxID=1963835 RepID=A0A212RNI2_9PROT|nr:MFS transporter [Arboricoccus pini]SNB74091.1 Sugar phosphate permease [Arboricoccus pini]